MKESSGFSGWVKLGA